MLLVARLLKNHQVVAEAYTAVALEGKLRQYHRDNYPFRPFNEFAQTFYISGNAQLTDYFHSLKKTVFN